MFDLHLQDVLLGFFESLTTVVFVIVNWHFSPTENLVPCSERHCSKAFENASAE